KKATNEVQIIIYENKKISANGRKNLEIYDYPNKEIITYSNQQVDKLRICFNKNCPLCENAKKLFVYTFKKNCPYCSSETVKLNRIRIKINSLLFQLINKIESEGDLNYLNHINFPRMIRGEEDKGLKQVKAILNKDLNGSCYFINAKDDFRYYFIEKKRSFNIDEINDSVLKGDNYEYYKNPKLLIKHNNIIPEAIYMDENICFTSSVYSLLHDDPTELKFLCAILNSILMQFYCMYGINNQKDTTINLNQYMIRHLPIVKPESQVKSEIVKKTDNVLNLFEASTGELNEDIIKVLREIDNLIFNLYSITDNERNIIINNVKNKIDFFDIIYSFQ
ncbi:MAG: TaqI-like C-terminal specificity domain-containing protein, partial [Promethearchaeota archaeon]